MLRFVDGKDGEFVDYTRIDADAGAASALLLPLPKRNVSCYAVATQLRQLLRSCYAVTSVAFRLFPACVARLRTFLAFQIIGLDDLEQISRDAEDKSILSSSGGLLVKAETTSPRRKERALLGQPRTLEFCRNSAVICSALRGELSAGRLWEQVLRLRLGSRSGSSPECGPARTSAGGYDGTILSEATMAPNSFTCV